MSNKLPSDYQEVEYIESTGTQYIDTGIIPNNTINIDMNLKVTNSINSVILGSDENWQINNFVIYINSNQFALGFGELGSNAKTVFNVNELYKLTLKNKELYINDEIGVSYKIHQVQVSDCKNNISLFALNRNKTIRENSFIKLYSLKIYDNDVLIRNFIPCYRKSDNEIGLYDIANNTFYTNQGTGVFLKGQNVYSTVADKLDYLIETKQQIKDALETPNNIMRKYPPLIKKYVDNQPVDITIDGVCKNSLNVPVKKVDINGNSNQKTYQGYNLFCYKSLTTTDRGITTTISENNKIEVIGTASGTWANGSPNLPFTLNTGTYILSSKNPFNFQLGLKLKLKDGTVKDIIANGSPLTITSNVTHTYIYYQGFTSGQSINETIYLQLEEGSTKKPYEPYVGGQPSPNPEYPQDIEVIDTVNLNNVILKNGQIISTGNFQYANNRITNVSDATEHITKLNKGTYTINAENLDFCSLMTKDNNNNILDNYAEQWNALPFTFTLNQDGYLFYTLRKNDNSDLNPSDYNVMLTKGIIQKPYLPYGCIGLEQSGTNIFDLSGATSASGTNNITDGVITSNELKNWSGAKIKVKPFSLKANETYYISFDVKKVNGTYNEAINAFQIMNANSEALISSSNYINRPILTNEYNRTICVLTPTKDIKGEMLYFQRNGNDSNSLTMQIKNIMISIENIDYEPYHSPKIYPINLNGNSLVKVGDIKDLLKIYRNGDVEIKKIFNIVKSTDIRIVGKSGTTKNNLFATNNFAKFKKPASDIEVCNLLSNYFIKNSGLGLYDESLNGIAFRIGKDFVLGFTKESNITTVELATEWLNTHNLEIYNELEEPQTIKLPSIEPIELWEGTNNFKLITNLDTTFEMEYVVKI